MIDLDLTGLNTVATEQNLKLLMSLLLLRGSDGRYHATPEIARVIENWLNFHRMYPVRILCIDGRLKALHCDIVVKPRKSKGARK